jgi:hypothetical protein
VTRLRRNAGLVIAALAVALVSSAASLAAFATLAGSGPPVTGPAATIGPYYSGPVHECWSDTNESVSYLEEHSTAQGNCLRGYTQLAVNELTPRFVLQLPGGPLLACTASTATAETALACSAPSPTPAPSTPAPSSSSAAP